MGGLLVAQYVDQHRGEPKYPIGVLTGLSRKILDGKRKEGPICDRVAVDQHQLGPLGWLAGGRARYLSLGRHKPTIVARGDMEGA